MNKINEYEYESPIKIKAYDPVANMTHHYNTMAIFDMSIMFSASTHIECEPEKLVISVERPPAHMYTLEELREMSGKPVWILFGDGTQGWAIVSLGYNNLAFYNDELWEVEEAYYNMQYDDPVGHFGLHVLGWVAYDRPPEEE